MELRGLRVFRVYVLGLDLQGLGLEGFRVFRFRLALRVEAQGEHLPLSEDELPTLLGVQRTLSQREREREAGGTMTRRVCVWIRELSFGGRF